jgi:hypothetical protein
MEGETGWRINILFALFTEIIRSYYFVNMCNLTSVASFSAKKDRGNFNTGNEIGEESRGIIL